MRDVVKKNSDENILRQSEVTFFLLCRIFHFFLRIASSFLHINLYLMKLYKLMTINDIAIHIDEGSRAKDLSRVKMRICENGLPNLAHTTKSYAQINGNELHWDQSFSFRYNGQSKVSFETYCEHEFGYELHELQVLYQGVYFLTNEMYFRRDSCHVYTPEGEKMGVLKWEVRVENKEEAEAEEQKREGPKPLVREDLIGLIKIEEMSLEVVNPLFNHKKYKSLEVKIKFGDQESIYLNCINNTWKIPELKLEYVSGGSQAINFEVLCEGRVVMEGSTLCSNMEKRYIKHRVSLFNTHGIKLCVLVIEYRFVEKKELLDLLYSPNSKLNTSVQRTNSNQLITHSQQKILPAKKKHYSFHQSPKGKTSRYQIGYLMNHNSDILLPKAARFPAAQQNSARVGYIDPQLNSDFSPSSGRGWHMSGGKKMDFTRQYRDNPGVGSYKLPSIWSKY